MRCPRCGEKMNGGIYDNCGFPEMKMKNNKTIVYRSRKRSNK